MTQDVAGVARIYPELHQPHYHSKHHHQIASAAGGSIYSSRQLSVYCPPARLTKSPNARQNMLTKQSKTETKGKPSPDMQTKEETP
jgi:hypothetical protein